MTRVDALNIEGHIAVSWLCAALGLHRSAIYRQRRKQHGLPTDKSKREASKHGAHGYRKLSSEEQTQVMELCHSERFIDKAPPEIYATLLDEGVYVCSVRTMYRILEQQQEVRERRAIVRHSHYAKPELLATAPNQVWSWDITKLLGPQKWTYYYLYVLLDIFSRYVVGWLVAERESGAIARHLIEESCEKQKVKPEGLIIHSDRGPPMISKCVAQLMGDLGITKSLNRPHVSNDNPFSEAQFKTLKYWPSFPGRFGSPQHARAWGRQIFPWYNKDHRHGGIGYYTPESVHYGNVQGFYQTRTTALNAAYAKHPERFVKKPPEPTRVPDEVWINAPKPEAEDINNIYF